MLTTAVRSALASGIQIVIYGQVSNDATLYLATLPEPAALSTLAAGVALVAALARRRSRHA